MSSATWMIISSSQSLRPASSCMVMKGLSQKPHATAAAAETGEDSVLWSSRNGETHNISQEVQHNADKSTMISTRYVRRIYMLDCSGLRRSLTSICNRHGGFHMTSLLSWYNTISSYVRNRIILNRTDIRPCKIWQRLVTSSCVDGQLYGWPLGCR